MLFSGSLAPKICLFLAAIALLSTPAMAGTLTASPAAVTISASINLPAPAGVQVTFTSSTGNPVSRIDSASVTENPTVFKAEISGASVYIGVNPSVLPSLSNGTYDGKVTVVAGGDSVVVPVHLLMGSTAQLTLSTNALTFSAPVGSTIPITQTVTLSSNATMTFTASVNTTSGGNWLAFSVPSTTASSTPMTVTVTASPAGLSAGSYSGTISFAPTSGTTLASTLNVTLVVGGTGALYANPTSMSFAFTTSTGIPPAQTLYLTSSSASQYAASVSSTGNWLLINGTANSTVGNFSSGTATLNISVYPVGLSAGVYQGTITVLAGNGSASIPVSLAVNTTLSSVVVSPATVSLVSPAGSLTYATQILGMNTSVSGGTFSALPYSPSGWLSLSATAGNLANGQNSITVYGNPSGLTAGTYAGQITLTFGGTLTGTQTIPVSFVVGSSGSTGGFTTVTPNSLTFYMQKGRATSSTLVPQTVAVSGSSGSGVSVSGTTTSGGNWLTVNTASGIIPFQATVGVDIAIANTLSANTYTGSLTFQSPTGTITAPVNLVVSDNAVVMPVPAAITVNYDPGTTLNAQYITLFNSGSSTDSITYTATPSVSWISLYGSPTGTITGGQAANLAIVITPAGLPSGVNAGAVTISSSGGGNSSISIPVTVVVSGTQGLTFSPSTLSFTTPAGVAPASQTLTVSSSASVTLSASATTSSGGNWLAVSPATATAASGAPASLTVSVTPGSLAAGSYSGNIVVSTGTGSQQIPVTLTIGAATGSGLLAVEDKNFTFDYLQGAQAPAAQTMLVQAVGGALSYTTSSTGGMWLTVSPASAITPSTVTVSVNPQGLGAGTYTGSVSVSSSSAVNSPVSRSVTLIVRSNATIGVSPNSLAFTYRADGTVPAAQQLAITSSAAALSFTASSSAPWLQVTPATGTTPANIQAAVNPTGLNPGRYNGTITVSTTGATPSSSATVDVSFVISAPLPTITRVTNAASYVDGPLSPGEIVVLFGSAMGPNEIATLEVGENGRVATALAGTSVFFNGLPAPMVYTSASQVSAVVPYGIAGRTNTSVWLEYRGVRSNSITMDVATSAPGIFTANASGTGPGAILNQDYGLNASASAAARGSVVMIYCTGEGQTIPLGTDGKLNNDPNNLPKPVLPVTVMIDNKPARVLYYGAAPSLLSGLMQVNAEIPASASTGQVPVTVTVGSVTSQPGVTVAVK